MADHVAHEAIHSIAALVLVVGGVLTLVLAALDRRRRNARAEPVRGAVPTPLRPETALRDLIRILGLGLAFGAGAIHLAAAPGHVEELGDLGLGFYWAAIFQFAWAWAWAARPGRPRLAVVGIVGSLAISAAWLWSRIVGLPVGPEAGHAEAIGVADAAATLFQLLLVLLLVASQRLPRTLDLPRAARAVRIAVVPMVGVLFLASLLAVSTAVAGHHDTTMTGPDTMVSHTP